MKCSTCKGTGKVEVEGMQPDEVYTSKCDVCMGKGERDIVITVTLWDEDNECEIKSENVSVDYVQGAEAVARLVKYAQEN
jgi:DnaJ-class molecular chaperone